MAKMRQCGADGEFAGNLSFYRFWGGWVDYKVLTGLQGF